MKNAFSKETSELEGFVLLAWRPKKNNFAKWGL
jgi:hypothetical protein